MLPESGKYYTDKEVAGLLGISLGRLRNKLSAGQPLPPRIQPPRLPQPALVLRGRA